MNLDYALTDQEGQLTLPDVPEKASTLWLPVIHAWQKFLDMNVVGMAHETQKTGFEIHHLKERRWIAIYLSPTYRYRALNSPWAYTMKRIGS